MKKITLTLAAIAAAFTMNAQSDCANASAVTVGADDTTTETVNLLSGTTPTSICLSGYYDETQVDNAAWYSYTSSQDLLVTVFSDVPTDTATDYVPSFNIYTGSCSSLTCVGGDLITANQNTGAIIPAETTFLAEAGETYYIVFDDYYSFSVGLGANASFDFTVTTDSNIPAAPNAASNPTPADGATGIDIVPISTGGNGVELSWELPTTGEEINELKLMFGEDPNDLTTYTFNNSQATSVTFGGADFFTFEENTQYYWAIIPSNYGGDASYTVWSFTTGEEVMSVADTKQEVFTHYINNGQLLLEANSSLESVQLYSILGQQVASQKLSSNKESIDISHLQAGIYLAQVQVGGKTKTFKFVKK